MQVLSRKFDVIKENRTKPCSLLSVFLRTDQMWPLMWSFGFHFCLLRFSSQLSTFDGYFLNDKYVKRVKKGFPRYSRWLLMGRIGEWSWTATWLKIVCNNLIYRVHGITRRKPSNLLLYRKSYEVWGNNPSNMKRFNRHSVYDSDP